MYKFYEKDRKIFARILSDGKASIMFSGDEGFIVKGSKRELLKVGYKKTKKSFEITEKMKYQIEDIIERYNTDKIGILNYTEDYLTKQELTDRKEYFQNLTEEEYEKSLEELKD